MFPFKWKYALLESHMQWNTAPLLSHSGIKGLFCRPACDSWHIQEIFLFNTCWVHPFLYRASLMGLFPWEKTSLHPSLLFRLRKHATITYYPHTQKDANNYSDWGSHARGCASKLQNKLNKQYEVTGFVQPGAGIRNVITVTKS